MEKSLHGGSLLWALTDVARQLQQARTVEQLLSTAGAALDGIGLRLAVFRLLGDQRVHIMYLSPRTLEETLTLFAEPVIGFTARLPPDSPFAVSIASLRSVFMGDLAQRAQEFAQEAMGKSLDLEQLERSMFTRALLCTLQVGHKPWGGFTVSSNALDLGDQPALELFAAQFSSALETVEAIHALEERTRELEAIHAIAAFDSGQQPESLATRMLEAIGRATGSEAVCLHRYVAEEHRYTLVGECWGYAGPLVEAFRTFPANEAVLNARLSAFEAKSLPAGSELVVSAGFSSLAMAPLKEGERPLGLLSLARRNALAYTERDLNTASLLGPHVAKLLERARLYEQLKESYAQLNRAQSELVRHERLAALGELSAVMAHEVRNPLGVIFNSVASLKKLMKPSGDAALLLRIVGEEAERLNRIVGDLLDFARPYEPERKAVPLEVIIAGAVDAAVQAVAGENIRVLTDFPLELPRFAVDGQLVRQAVVNLVVNAMQAMPKGGTVTVRATGEQSPGGELYACIQVRDEGVGISATAAGRIFEPFFTTKATGTGLGLAVVKRIVDAHHGEISVESSPAGGTTFTVRLPGGEAAA